MVNATTTASILDDPEVQRAMGFSYQDGEDNGYIHGKLVAWRFILSQRHHMDDYTDEELQAKYNDFMKENR